MVDMDRADGRLLTALQRDADQSLEALGEAVGLSRNACWRRIRRLEEAGVIRGRVALCDPAALGLGLSVFIAVRTERHDAEWLELFARAVREIPEILGAYRTSGDTDYVLRARVHDVTAYDRLYQRLIRRVPLKDISASFVMEELKETSALPVDTL
ncbi:Lrp/AsnC family transcriptional regulator [Paralimibaculum aggregatum]|uniref:Lrp/AsnC family transcriptional regulator n=1 Tax=Paralimibaculum aggregatum TaxID=3036245 RepID=A0ABQ6LPF3_9RHOB|nr:Lrp/AsnC family transcriptional regulator [Limibaculum sp. NKW23]GMG82529.1 Lrp/AsnC family transcriptional regulator [Limibaculum sp. NKW23]